jgi:hypothetical protein
MAPVASVRLMAGRLVTRPITAVQILAWPAPAPTRARFLPTIGSRRAFTLSPMMARMAGSRVRAAATETTPTMMAPAARLRMMFVGTRNIPSNATTKVLPLNSTARPAVALLLRIASSVAKPRLRSSRKREITNSE